MIQEQITNVFNQWDRRPTNTELVAQLLINAGLDIEKPREFHTVYRVQPKLTGGEERRALCYLGRHNGCEDIQVVYQNHIYIGIDLLASVSDLVKHGLELHRCDGDDFLWVIKKK